MADNKTTTATVSTVPSGTVIATDEIGGVDYQRVKLSCGPDGTATDVPVGGGVEAAALRVTIASDSTGVLSVDDNGASLTIDNAQLSVVGGGTEAAAMRVTIANDSTGVLSVDDNGGALTVDNGGTFAVQATLAAGATNIAKAEDVASAGADVGVPAMAVQKATPANTAGTDGDYEFLQMSAGRLWTSATIDAALPAGTAAIGKLAANSGVDIGDVDVVSLTGSSVAHDAADSGNPHKVGFQARTTNPAVVADADRVNAIADKQGRQIVQPFAPRDLVTIQHTQIASSSSETTILTAGAAGVFHDLTALIITLQTATACTVTIKDATAGTTRMVLQLPATVGAIAGATFTVPVPQASAANNWTATLSSAAVTVNFFVQAVKTL